MKHRATGLARGLLLAACGVALGRAARADEPPIRALRETIAVSRWYHEVRDVVATPEAVAELTSRLQEARYRVVTLDEPASDPASYLRGSPEVDAVVEGLFREAAARSGMWASVSVRGVEEPRRISGGSAAEVVSRVVAYLRSEEAVTARARAGGAGPEAPTDDRGRYARLVDGGIDALQSGRWEEALAAFRQAASLRQAAGVDDRHLAALHFNMSKCYRAGGDLNAARREIRAALGLDPESLAARNGEARFLLEEGRYDDAIKILRRLAEANPYDPVPHWNLAYAYIQVGDFDQARRHIARVASTGLRLSDEADVLEERLEAAQRGLEESRRREASRAWAQRVALVGLVASGLIALGMTFARRGARGLAGLLSVEKVDRAALLTNVVIAAINAVFGLVSLLVGHLLG